jgi:hypothetical protein
MRKTLVVSVHGAADLTVGGRHVLHPRGSGHGAE